VPLQIHTSNRMENLVESLATVVARPLSSPFISETIVVQSKGMQRWLAMELAARFGVWANSIYPFPNAMIWRLFRSALPELSDTYPFSPEVLTWKLMALLPRFLHRQESAELQRYLGGDTDGLKHFQLAEKIADTFDQYTLFRPEMLLEWERGESGDWQAILWRELIAAGEGEHRGRLKEAFCRHLAGGAPGVGLPERICVFGISYLPSYHLEVLSATARHTEVNLFLLSPCREYWADIAGIREQARMSTEQLQLRIEGNPLLASLGRLGRDFSEMVLELAEVAGTQDDLYRQADGSTLLRQIQADILDLRGADPEEGRRPIQPGDRSVQIHSCHSPLREIEVLHDQLLALLEGEPGLTPRDIVVMTPDIEGYAPYIATVFDGCQDPARRIPYSIADRSLASEGQIAAVLLKLLAVPGSRMTAVQLLDILESAPVLRRFDLDDEGLDRIRRWVEETRVRWGIDEQDRLRLGLPGYRDHSWRAGLDRLLLGYAMPEEVGCLFNGKLPYDAMEGSGAGTLGKLAAFIEGIAALADGLQRARSLDQWRAALGVMLADFIAADDAAARELATVAALVESLGELAEQADCGEPVTFAVVRAWLSARLQQAEKGLGFLTGGVTFCAMLPMRSIPFRIVALIGMSEGAFPRQSRPPAFDLMARHPRRGDRSLRDEDRYLFLEAILSARDGFYLSYVGQSVRDNSEIPPSVLVSEFLDAIERGFTAGEGEKIVERLLTRHRLQAFSPDYFTESSPLFSYSAELCAALHDRRSPQQQGAAFLHSPLAEPAAEWRDVPLDRLLRFFAHPARFFLEHRLGIRLAEDIAPLAEKEPFLLDHLESYQLKTELLEAILRGERAEDFLPVARCRGILPPGRHGQVLFAGATAAVQGFAALVQEAQAGTSLLPPLEVQLDIGGFRLSGRLEGLLPQSMLRYRCAKLKGKDQLRTWIEHLVLNAVQPAGYPRETRLLMVDADLNFAPVDNAAEVLGSLLDLYWQGLSEPLRHFPASSAAFAKKWLLKDACSAWEKGYNDWPGEGDDPTFRLCFGQADPFNEEFERIARLIFEPMQQANAKTQR
jgi:exodeoxyribonuclease V gamma subunit